MSSENGSPVSSPDSSQEPTPTHSSEHMQLVELYQLLERLSKQKALTYNPYPKQAEFHELGATKRKRCLMAANQVGKTYCAGMETAYHLTGLYPDWWKGRRFASAVRCWVGGPSSEHVRDNAQRILFGTAGDEGTGTIPVHTIRALERSRGIKNAIDYALVLHKSGQLSYVNFKSYDQEMDTWSGDTLHFIWYDEEPPFSKYSEGITRTNTGDNGRPGFVYLTLTPLLGMTKVAKTFHPRPRDEDAALIRMGLKDALHYNADQISSIASTYQAHERKARVDGYPQLGEGAVFPYSSDDYVYKHPEEEPRWWLYIGGIDFGWDHPCALVECGWDRDNDVFWVLREWRRRHAVSSTVTTQMRRWGKAWLPWAWPHDGWVHDRQSGVTTAQLFEDDGVRMLPTHAQYPDGHSGLEASLIDMNERIGSGRLRISERCPLLVEEMETYHRDEKFRVVKLADDLISAVRYALMMKHFGALPGGMVRFPQVIGRPSERSPLM